MPTRIAIARLWHEGNSFTPVHTRLADFRQREWSSGADAEVFYRGTRTELGAAVDFFAAHRELTPIYLRCAAAGPGGAVEEADVQQIIREIVEGVRKANADALYLSLHGALIGSDTLLADVVLLKEARAALGEKPLAVSFDLHANLDPVAALLADIVVGYKTHPHVDMYETGARAARPIFSFLNKKIKPTMHFGHRPMLPHVMRQSSLDSPNREIQERAKEMERQGALAATFFVGFPHADIPYAGSSAVVVTDGDAAKAQAFCDELLETAWRAREQFVYRVEALEKSLLRAKELQGRPVVLLDH